MIEETYSECITAEPYVYSIIISKVSFLCNTAAIDCQLQVNLII